MKKRTQNHEPLDQEKMDDFIGWLLFKPRTHDDLPPATKADHDRKFRITLDGGKPVFEEVKDD